MDTTTTQDKLNEKLRARFKELPKVVQDAVTSADIEKQLRVLADTNRLHLDKWQLLENNVMLTLFGFQAPEELAENLKADLDISADMAKILTDKISKIVFEPIREELERELPPQERTGGDADVVPAIHDTPLNAARSAASGEHSVEQNVLASTPLPLPKIERAVRAPVSESYSAQTPSHERKSVEGDPYRESIA
jgi:hypothetical protein